MLKSIFISGALALFSLSSFSQAINPKHINYFEYISPIVTNDIKIEITNPHARYDFFYMKLRITNKTNDFMSFKTDEIVVTINGKEYRPFQKTFLIGPRDYISRSIKITGDTRFHEEEVKVKLSGFYKIAAQGKTAKVPDFHLPHAYNNFNFDNFTCKVAGKVIKETQVTEVPFRCTYIGTDIGMIESSRMSIKLVDGKEFANVNTGSKLKNIISTGSTDVLYPGEKSRIVAIYRVPATTTDMQFAEMDILFNDTFSESKEVPLPTHNFTLTLDNNKTAIKNK